MDSPQFDPGLTQRFERPLRRIVNKDGSFNVHRRGTTWRDVHPYLWLIDVSWLSFLAVLLAGYIMVNLLFASFYYMLGSAALVTPAPAHGLEHFMTCFFFSAQTLTTVGYGTIAPHGMGANLLATFEAGLGLVGLSLGTGLLFGRVSRPSARIAFSPNVLVAPYQDGSSLQFRIVNKRRNSLMNLEATVVLMTVEQDGGEMRRRYHAMKLERSTVFVFPLTWTLVHPIDEASPIRGLTAPDLERLQAELLILIKGFDETFAQTVHSRHSYRYDEVIWGARFRPAFYVDDAGDMVVRVDEVGAIVAPPGSTRA